MPDRLLSRTLVAQILPPLVGLAFFAAALYTLLASLLTVLGYLVLTAYDHLAIAYVRQADRPDLVRKSETLMLSVLRPGCEVP
jgi:hypothetical protein